MSTELNNRTTMQGVEPLTQEEILYLQQRAEADKETLQDFKNKARHRIREQKDLEDDLTDLKKVVQFMARGFAGLWASLPQEVKDANAYKENFDNFSSAVASAQLRLDLEADQVAKIAKILQDEESFAQIVQDEYLSKVQI